MFIALNNVHQGYKSVNSSAVHMECWTNTFGRMVQIAMLPFSIIRSLLLILFTRRYEIHLNCQHIYICMRILITVVMS
jgi:hypothetical protein